MDGPATLDHLPQDVAVLHGLIRELLAAIQDERRRNEQLTHRLDLLLKRVYGPRADRLDPGQLSLFDEPPAGDAAVATSALTASPDSALLRARSSNMPMTGSPTSACAT